MQEKSSWRICSTRSLDTISLPTTVASSARGHHNHHPPHHHHHPHRRASGRDNGGVVKAGVLQLPLCEKTISVNIQRGGGASRDGLLCSSAQASCCQVI